MNRLAQPGDVIGGKYVIERLLGQGGMGAVFVARQDQLGRRVAIKFLLPSAGTNAEVVARFDREARAAASLQSDHVTRVLDVGRLDDGAPYMVMELLDGEDLAQMLARRGPLPVGEVIEMIVQACDALAEAHALGIVHRDLKPANVFLAMRPNGTTTVKVLDFGISKAPPGGGMSLTASSAVMGSPLYMSPEQLTEARNVDGRADIWALGATLYELLTGSPPFAAQTLAEICALVLTTRPASLRVSRPEIPETLDAVVLRCLRKDPADRFASVGDLVAALDGIPVPMASMRATADAFAMPPTLASPSPRSSESPRASRSHVQGGSTARPVSSTPLPQQRERWPRPSTADAAGEAGGGAGTRWMKRAGTFAVVAVAAVAAVAALVASTGPGTHDPSAASGPMTASAPLHETTPLPEGVPAKTFEGTPAATVTAAVPDAAAASTPDPTPPATVTSMANTSPPRAHVDAHGSLPPKQGVPVPSSSTDPSPPNKTPVAAGTGSPAPSRQQGDVDPFSRMTPK